MKDHAAVATLRINNKPKPTKVVNATANEGAHRKCVEQQIGDGGNNPFKLKKSTETASDN